LGILLGNGDGTFQPGVSIGSMASSCDTGFDLGAGLAVADLRSDGKLDVVMTNLCGAVYLGNGDGTFQDPQFVAAYGFSLAVADFNNDGIPDIVTADSSAVNVALGNGDGTFRDPLRYVAGLEPLFVATGDFNGDGFQDVVAVHRFGVSVLLNADDWGGSGGAGSGGLPGLLPAWPATENHYDPRFENLQQAAPVVPLTRTAVEQVFAAMKGQEVGFNAFRFQPHVHVPPFDDWDNDGRLD
jgi:hypothetical protein